jgi:hypothetical protein
MARSGERVRGRVPARASNEADLTRGGVQPPSEAGLTRGRGTSPQARRASPEGVPSPRVRRSFVSAVLRPARQEEVRPRVPGPVILVGRWGHQGRDYVVHVLGLRICLFLCF